MRNKKFMRISAEETAECFRRMEAGDPQARERVIEGNAPLAAHIANQFVGRGVDVNDLVQEGIIALIKAVDRFEPQRGYKFSTLAWRLISQHLQACVDQESHLTFRANYESDRRRVMRKAEELKDSLNRVPSFDEIAEIDWLGAAHIETLMDTRARYAIPLDSEVPHQPGLTIADLIASQEPSPEEQAEDRIQSEQLKGLVSKQLRGRNALIVILFFGLLDNQDRTLTEIGKVLKLSKERVRQLLNESLERLGKSEIVQEMSA